ncbi:hypothetical protein ONS95_013355 [Cadophora gregata]|uniref:uncharacterized protein n=1 Tax=Cadophora gregata TaxID=51156 RepID=UPI0026DC0FDE|nr:uncharacterized protein ONS95_013355 [Cadophora gregata]KAK0099752.1 hypothetical protein ONS96_008249 [Cadophora gregata f. sp. sojae]KAK0116334.1 hypothetical protein ONS95_013355 [Cadophora gregata]
MSLTDIHSKTWAEKIVLQLQSSLLSLPGEVRTNIWKNALKCPQRALPYSLHDSTSCGFGYVPLGFVETTCGIPKHDWWAFRKSSSRTTLGRLIITSRQMYVDIVGGNLFYKANAFSLDVLERNQFYALDQLKLDCITSLHFTWRRPLGNTPEDTPKLFQDLAMCQNLKYLVLSLYITVVLNIDPDSKGETNFKISDKSLDNIRNLPAFRALKGLKTFELRIRASSDTGHTLVWRSSRDPDIAKSATPRKQHNGRIDLISFESIRIGLHNNIKLRQLEADLKAQMSQPRLEN